MAALGLLGGLQGYLCAVAVVIVVTVVVAIAALTRVVAATGRIGVTTTATGRIRVWVATTIRHTALTGNEDLAGRTEVAPHLATIVEAGRELVLPLENRSVIQQARTAFGTTAIADEIASLRSEMIAVKGAINYQTDRNEEHSQTMPQRTGAHVRRGVTDGLEYDPRLRGAEAGAEHDARVRNFVR